MQEELNQFQRNYVWNLAIFILFQDNGCIKFQDMIWLCFPIIPLNQNDLLLQVSLYSKILFILLKKLLFIKNHILYFQN